MVLRSLLLQSAQRLDELHACFASRLPLIPGIVAAGGVFVVATSFMVPDTVLCIIAGVLFGLGMPESDRKTVTG